MPFWSGETFCEWIPRFNIIDPFDSSRIDCASYTLRMGREAYITPDYQISVLSKHKIYKLDKDDDFTIPAGQFGFLLTEEIVAIPNHVMGFISLRTPLKFQGLINVSGFHVDPGFRGHLIYAVYNAGPSQIHLARGMDLFKIWLATLDRIDSGYVRRSEILIENVHLSPSLIKGISGKILSMQSLSDRLSNSERELYIIKASVSLLVVIIGLIFAAAKIDWKALFS